jgi:hypothetical protein
VLTDQGRKCPNICNAGRSSVPASKTLCLQKAHFFIYATASHKTQLSFLRRKSNQLCSSHGASCAVPGQQKSQEEPTESWCTVTWRPPVWKQKCEQTAAVGPFQTHFSTDRNWILTLIQIEIRSFIPLLKTWQEYLSLNAFIRQTEYFPNRNSREISKSHASLWLELGFHSQCRMIHWSPAVTALSCPQCGRNLSSSCKGKNHTPLIPRPFSMEAFYGSLDYYSQLLFPSCNRIINSQNCHLIVIVCKVSLSTQLTLGLACDLF